ncbi:MAG: sugar phosphate nucleotidyltransferase [Planctomycetota bacterium]
MLAPSLRSRAVSHRFGLVLAGGSGKRLESLTTDANGRAVPKQYRSLLGRRSLLGDALARAERLVTRSHIVTVVAAQHEPFWRRELADRTTENVVVQPRNRGTAAGVLLPLLAIAARDPAAVVTLLPSDHFVADEESLIAALRRAQAAAARLPTKVLLVGVQPDGPEADYGWILPGTAGGPVRPVRSFHEKPPAAAAAVLLRAGALWNSFLVVATARALIRLFRMRLPDLLDPLRAVLAHHDPALTQRFYDAVTEHDFCRHVLEGAETDLGLCVAPSCGWTDLGTPHRVATCLATLGVDRANLAPDSLAAAALATVPADAPAP